MATASNESQVDFRKNLKSSSGSNPSGTAPRANPSMSPSVAPKSNPPSSSSEGSAPSPVSRPIPPPARNTPPSPQRGPPIPARNVPSTVPLQPNPSSPPETSSDQPAPQKGPPSVARNVPVRPTRTGTSPQVPTNVNPPSNAPLLPPKGPPSNAPPPPPKTVNPKPEPSTSSPTQNANISLTRPETSTENKTVPMRIPLPIRGAFPPKNQTPEQITEVSSPPSLENFGESKSATKLPVTRGQPPTNKPLESSGEKVGQKGLPPGKVNPPASNRPNPNVSQDELKKKLSESNLSAKSPELSPKETTTEGLEEVETAEDEVIPYKPKGKKELRERCKANFDYDATEDEELTFKENDIIYIKQKDDSGFLYLISFIFFLKSVNSFEKDGGKENLMEKLDGFLLILWK